MALTVRRAKEKDIPKILDLLVQVNMVHHKGRPDIFDGPATKYQKEELLEMIGDGDKPIFVGVDEEDQVLGYLFCVKKIYKDDGIFHDRRELYIDDFCVDEQVRGQGIGKLMFQYIRQYAKDEGFYDLTLNVWSCNPAAMKFYEAQGMQMLKKEMELRL